MRSSSSSPVRSSCALRVGRRALLHARDLLCGLPASRPVFRSRGAPTRRASPMLRRIAEHSATGRGSRSRSRARSASAARCCRSPTRRGIVDFARGLAELGVELVSTGGTARGAARAPGSTVRADRRLHRLPGDHGRPRQDAAPASSTPACSRVRDNAEHMRAAARARHRVRRPRVREPLPVRAHRRRAAAPTEAEVIENIDIGGPTMIRAAAKNYAFAAVVVEPESYDAVLEELREADGTLSLATRECARRRGVRLHRALRHRDRALVRREAARTSRRCTCAPTRRSLDLPYGENPHQRAAYYAQVGARTHVLSHGRASTSGKELSFNNLLDLDAARAARARVRGPGLRDRQAQQPVRRGRRRRRARGLPSARSRATR